MDEHRSRRISEAVREEISELIEFEMEDPRIRSVSVTGAEVSPDKRHAHVRVAISGGAEEAALAALEHAKHFLRHELATRLNLRRIPDLHFSVDSHPDADSRIDFLLRRARKSRARD
ncbi:MAG TPA: 30S ribosome-binding factor RbfA [Bryobacteraceae bacterium]|jgi:ribosome-binding factor A|nr:30S ribosome-binding factor RbfA [Bryobacteraceae bacterium]